MAHRAAVLLLVLLLAPTASAAVVISGLATDLPGSTDDDAVELRNDGDAPETLDGLILADESGALRLPDGFTLAPGAALRLATNATAYRLAAREAPDLSTDATDVERRLTVADPGFGLAQRGGVLFLRRGEALMDAVVYGDSSYDGPGWVGPSVVAKDPFLRWTARVERQDSDTRFEWDSPQHPFLGWRERSLPTFHVTGEAVAYTAPDRSREMVVDSVRRATTTLRLNVYELRDVGIADDIVDQMERHPRLRVDVLQDSTPVGLSAEERLVRDGIVQHLTQAGATVRFLAHDRYAFNHAKYLIVDDRMTLVQTENLVPGALPPGARDGNRGWGVRLDDEGLAKALAAVFDADFALDPYGASDADRHTTLPPLPAFASATPKPRLEAATVHDVNATLVVTPEANLGADDPMMAMLAEAKEEILIEQLALPPYWRDSFGQTWPHEYLNAVLEAARRGVRVKILLDGHFLDGGPDDNAATVRMLEETGKLLPVEARLMDGPDDHLLHVKGVVVDRRTSWVGSMNWNLNSIAQNREVSLILDAPALADLYVEAFEEDWDRAHAPKPTTTRSHIDAPGLAATVITLAFLVLAPGRRK